MLDFLIVFICDFGQMKWLLPYKQQIKMDFFIRYVSNKLIKQSQQDINSYD